MKKVSHNLSEWELMEDFMQTTLVSFMASLEQSLTANTGLSQMVCQHVLLSPVLIHMLED